jgi:hypothetical protein
VLNSQVDVLIDFDRHITRLKTPGNNGLQAGLLALYPLSCSEGRNGAPGSVEYHEAAEITLDEGGGVLLVGLGNLPGGVSLDSASRIRVDVQSPSTHLDLWGVAILPETFRHTAGMGGHGSVGH